MKSIKKHAYTILFSTLLLTSNAYVLLKTYVLPEAMTTVEAQTAAQNASSESVESSEESEATTTSETTTATTTGEVTQTDTTYQDDNISISITTGQTSNTTYYVADIILSDASYLKTALAQNTYGTNITQTTSEMAQANNAIFAINGDYYGANTSGYVIKNGVLYRDTARSSENEDLAITNTGEFITYSESDTTAQELLASGVVNTFAFGPTLISDGQIAVSENEEVGQAKSSNPRTAIGVIETDDGTVHYIVIVSDGRTSESEGLSLYEMAELMQSYGVTTAYNLDGGGSSTMYFNGQVVNNPTTNGNRISERAVSDIVYVGY